MSAPDASRLAALEERVIALESHVAHLESANQDMSDVIARQSDSIDRLTRTLKMLHDQILAAQPAPDVQKPPHY